MIIRRKDFLQVTDVTQGGFQWGTACIKQSTKNAKNLILIYKTELRKVESKKPRNYGIGHW